MRWEVGDERGTGGNENVAWQAAVVNYTPEKRNATIATTYELYPYRDAAKW
jgi:hypothetical protein